jgi:endoglucanase
MKNTTMNNLTSICAVGLALALTGCKSTTTNCTAKCEPVAVIAPVVPSAPAAAVEKPSIIRIKAGASSPVTDAAGNVWLADQGFEGGDVIDRPDVPIANTKNPEIYHAERYAMESFSYKLPNGKYQVKLHFAETYDGITGPGERVFSFNVEGQEFKEFDVVKKAGGVLRAYVETVNVEIADGKLDIKFTSEIENPEINGIEIIPAS